MNTNADMNLFVLFFLSIVGVELTLNLLGALHGVHHRGKVHQEGIPDSFDDVSVVSSNRFACDIRTAERNRPGDTPVASLKMREKWNRLRMALLAMSESVSDSR